MYTATCLIAYVVLMKNSFIGFYYVCQQGESNSGGVKLAALWRYLATLFLFGDERKKIHRQSSIPLVCQKNINSSLLSSSPSLWDIDWLWTKNMNSWGTRVDISWMIERMPKALSHRQEANIFLVEFYEIEKNVFSR